MIQIVCMLALVLFSRIDATPTKDLSQLNIPLYHIAEKQLAEMNDSQMDSDWKLNHFFGMIYVINDVSNKEGLNSITKELKNINVTDFEVFPSVEGRTLNPVIHSKFQGEQIQEAGRYMTHYRLLRRIQKRFEKAVLDLYKAEGRKDEKAIIQAKADVRKFSRVLIVKDSIGFGIPDAAHKRGSKSNLGRTLRKSLQDLPPNWDMVYFYAKPYQRTEPITPLVQRINKSYYDVAYAVNYKMYGPLIHHLKKIDEPNIHTLRHIDHQISHIHKDYNVYSFLTPFVYIKRFDLER